MRKQTARDHATARERHHDVAPVDEAGTLLAKARITDDVVGYHQLMALLAEHGDSPDDPIPVAIETSHGLLVASLRTGSRRVFAINPLAAARPSMPTSCPASRMPRPSAHGPAQATGDATCQTADDLAEAAIAAFHQHADSEILLSSPGLGTMLGARVLAELGDDQARFADAWALKSYAGSAPITRASGKKRFVGRRFVKNDRLINAGFLWALTASPPHQ